ncbi:MAG: hypothetical protein VB858_19175, partial [Planctomycetaceae bacterium]
MIHLRMIISGVCLTVGLLGTARAGDLFDQLNRTPNPLIVMAEAVELDSAATSSTGVAPTENADGKGVVPTAGCCAGSKSWYGVSSGGCLLGNVFGTASDVLCPFGIDLKSDRAFDRFIEPVTNPVFFEDPRSRTRLRFLFINQLIPEGSLLRGGDLQVYGLEAAIALTDRLSFIAQKDGYIELQSDLLPKTEGT